MKPIFLYTSELKVKGSQNKVSSIYRILNELLRNEKFTHTPQCLYRERWEYQFMYQLIQQLDKIEPCQESPLYRGVGYQPEHK